MSKGELERVTRRYVTGIMDILGPDRDVPAPDMGTDGQVMAWFMDTYSMHQRSYLPASVTGKPISLGGSLGRVEATGRGVMLCAREALKHLGMNPKECTAVIQGAGNVGMISALQLARIGVKVVAISDVRGGLYNKDGLDLAGIRQHLQKRRTLDGFDGGAQPAARLGRPQLGWQPLDDGIDTDDGAGAADFDCVVESVGEVLRHGGSFYTREFCPATLTRSVRRGKETAIC